MESKIYSKLEFDSILKQVSLKAKSNYVKELITNQKHEIDYERVVEQLNKTDEIMKLFISYGEYSLEGFNDIMPYLNKVEQKKTLSGIELREITAQQDLISSMDKYIHEIESNKEYPYFMSENAKIQPIIDLALAIEKKINPQGLVYEDASNKLVYLNQEIINTNEKITSYLRDFIAKNKDHLMEDVVTFRNNRAVVLVKIASKNIIKGIVHDESSSKQTAFIEPSKVVEYNNYLQSLEYQKNEEIEVILNKLTNQVADNIDNIKGNFDVFSELDLVKARASYSLEIDGNIPQINKDSAKLEIYAGRHPLIPKNEVVANDFFICNNETKYRIVLLSGSNTGGKTVALKMVGLFSLMAQSGLAISANEKSNLPIYSEIFVDIGDEQSIESSLSTFSSHLTNIAHITRNVSKYSLVLIDELGSGTDPREGENLALAILEYLYQKDASVIVTTHYSKLKNYALTTNYVRSASVIFDENYNRPKYKISFDTFASSNAFEIAEYLGLDKEIISKARQFYKDDLNTNDELLLKLQAQQQKVKIEQNKLNDEIKKYQEINKKITDKEKRTQEKYEDVLNKARENANEIINEAQKNAQIVIDKLKKQDSFINHEVNELNKELDKLYQPIEKTIDNSKQEFKENDLVKIIKINRDGIITKVLPRKNYEVTIGNIKTKVKHNEIAYLGEYKEPKEKKTKQKRHASKKVSTEINLIGLRVEDALIELKKYIDDALLANLSQVRIVHGFGTGALRKAVHEELRSNKNIDNYHFAEYNEGGQGATIANLK
ncbi:DNA mismatch repair protein MutS2 [Bacilli bacterium PM5-3]|nr:DNA mismatch repair protein MutS2 [Bacilli bacterium PM5-3]MDH6603259.1 DNA mismatch repair protein MutS2 [Bacilli bacterium PM5-9]